MPSSESTVSRRAVLAAGAGASAVLLTGCSLNNPFKSTSKPAAVAGDLSADVALAVSAVGLIDEALSGIDAATTAFPQLRGPLAGLRTLHATHLHTLRAAAPAGVDPTPSVGPVLPAATRAAALARQQQVEQNLHDRLTGLALRAESGPFARLLGSMAAAISQQLDVLANAGGRR